MHRNQLGNFLPTTELKFAGCFAINVIEKKKERMTPKNILDIHQEFVGFFIEYI